MRDQLLQRLDDLAILGYGILLLLALILFVLIIMAWSGRR